MTPDDDPLHSCAGVSAEELKKLLDLITDTDVTELDVTIGTARVSIRRPATSMPTMRLSPSKEDSEPSSLAIASPQVGIFRPAVTPGTAVEHGDPIGAIEALGIPTTVDSPQTGIVEQVLVADGGAVEYGQPLVILRRAP